MLICRQWYSHALLQAGRKQLLWQHRRSEQLFGCIAVLPRLSKQHINAMEAAAAPGVGECALERELRGGTLAAMSQVETPRPLATALWSLRS